MSESDQNFCKSCGQKTESVWSICPNCGQKLGQSAPADSDDISLDDSMVSGFSHPAISTEKLAGSSVGVSSGNPHTPHGKIVEGQKETSSTKIHASDKPNENDSNVKRRSINIFRIDEEEKSKAEFTLPNDPHALELIFGQIRTALSRDLRKIQDHEKSILNFNYKRPNLVENTQEAKLTRETGFDSVNREKVGKAEAISRKLEDLLILEKSSALMKLKSGIDSNLDKVMDVLNDLKNGRMRKMGFFLLLAALAFVILCTVFLFFNVESKFYAFLIFLLFVGEIVGALSASLISIEAINQIYSKIGAKISTLEKDPPGPQSTD